MAFVQRCGHYGLVRDSFPDSIARNTKECTEFEDLGFRNIKPGTKDGLFDWAKVIGAATRDPSRRHELVYKTPKDTIRNISDPSRVSLRIFGVLGSHNFQQYGNWNGYETNAPKATWFMRLDPGPFPQQYADQMEATDDIRHLIAKSLQDHRELRRADKRDLFFQRRVFKKADSSASRSTMERLETADIESKAQAISRRWVLDGAIKFGRKKESGGVATCDPLIFNVGDFVDVLVTFDIITTARGLHKTVSVHMSPSQVVRLATKDEIAKFCKAPPSPKACPPRATLVVDEDKLQFDDEGVPSVDDGSES